MCSCLTPPVTPRWSLSNSVFTMPVCDIFIFYYLCILKLLLLIFKLYNLTKLHRYFCNLTFLFSVIFWRFNYVMRDSYSSFKMLHSNFHKALYSSVCLRSFSFARTSSFPWSQAEFEFPLLAKQRLLVDPFRKLLKVPMYLSLCKMPIIPTISDDLG